MASIAGRGKDERGPTFGLDAGRASGRTGGLMVLTGGTTGVVEATTRTGTLTERERADGMD